MPARKSFCALCGERIFAPVLAPPMGEGRVHSHCYWRTAAEIFAPRAGAETAGQLRERLRREPGEGDGDGP